MHVPSDHVRLLQGALTMCTRTSTGKPCSFATLQMSTRLLALANPRHLSLDAFDDVASEDSNGNE